MHRIIQKTVVFSPSFHKLSEDNYGKILILEGIREERGGAARSTWLNVRRGLRIVVSMPRDRNGRSMFNRTWLNLPSLPFSLSLSLSLEWRGRDGGISVPLAALARSMGCRCENSISFRLSRGAATIFVFSVRARALPLNVPRRMRRRRWKDVPYASPRPSYSRGETRSENLSNVLEINDEFTRREVYSFLDRKSDA